MLGLLNIFTYKKNSNGLVVWNLMMRESVDNLSTVLLPQIFIVWDSTPCIEN